MNSNKKEFKIGFVYPGYENLSIEYLSANLKLKGFDTKLFLDPVLFEESGLINNKLLGKIFSFKKVLLREIIDYKPDLICFSVITDNYQWACSWAAEIKKHINIPVVMGGIHPSSVPERVIANQFVDYICIGEGDRAVAELADALANKKPVDKINNIWFKSEGEVVKNRVRLLIDDLDELPFPDKDLFYSASPVFNDGYTISASRGCPFSCSYCCNSVWKRIYSSEKKIFRRRSVGHVIDELKIAKDKYKPNYIAFLDEVFNYDMQWLNAFLETYKKEINHPFSCFIYPDLVTEQLVKDLKKAGCFKVQMGVQILDEGKRREDLGRSSSNEKIKKAIKLFKAEKIYVACDNIFGFLNEEIADLEKTAYFYNEYLPNHIEIFWLRYYPGTEITERSIEKKIIDKEKKEEIEDGRLGSGITRYGDHVDKYAKKISLLLYLFRFIPHRCRNYILRNKLYVYIPAIFSPISLYIIDRFLNRAKYDLNFSRTIKRYLFYTTKILTKNLLF